MQKDIEKQIKIGLIIVGIMLIGFSIISKSFPSNKNPTAEENKKQYSKEQISEPLSKDNDTLEFSINAKFKQFGEIEASIASNLKNIEVEMNVYSISQFDPEIDESNGIDYSRWYSVVDSNDRNMSLGNFPNDINSQVIDNNGTMNLDFVLFNDVAKSKGFTEYEINKLKASNKKEDNMLAMHAEAKNIFLKDKKVILEFRISKADLIKQGLDYDSIKLPKICNTNNFSDELIKNYEEVICRKEVVYSN